MAALDVVAAACCLLAAGVAAIRWLRVAQREGWAPGAATRWALRWWALDGNAVLGAVAVASLAAAPLFRPAVLATALALSLIHI